MKKILFIVPYVPSQIYIRSLSFIRHLTALGHQVNVMTLWSTPDDQSALARLAEECHSVQAFHLPRWRSALNVGLALPSGKPLQAVYCWQPQMAQALQNLFTNPAPDDLPDVIHVEHLRGVDYTFFLKWIFRYRSIENPPPIIWDSVDSISYLFRQASALSKRRVNRWITRFELGRTEKYERRLAQRLENILITSPKDRQAYVDLAGDEVFQKFHIVPNGVDLEYFTPDPKVVRAPATLIVSGKMSYHANISMVLHLVQEIMPIVWASNPEVRLQIVGKDPGKELKALAVNPNIEVTGTVADLRPYLRQATLALVPLTYGAGSQFKVLEAMATQTPVVAYPKAISSLQVTPGEQIWVATDPVEFAQGILKLLGDTSLRGKIATGGYQYVWQHHHWQTITSILDTIYTDAIAASRASVTTDGVVAGETP